MASRFALLGHPVAHSLSPVMHEASFRALKLDATYECIDVPPGAVSAALEQCRRDGFSGLNVTVPHKQETYRALERLDVSARRVGAVNTVRFDPDGGMTGFNTDAAGFLADLRSEFGLIPLGLRIMVVGCGGAGRALAIACALGGCSKLRLANRTLERAERVAEEIAGFAAEGAAPAEVVPLPEWVAVARDSDLIVQATTAGMSDGSSALPAEAFRPGQYLYDIVYTSPVTPTMAVAKGAGAWVANGLGMLVRQGAASFRIWTGREANVSAMRMAVEKRN
ncbi:MAG: shikimate dehydrogenase [Kiritimatiellae bacterium]|nr:shikimate dehydrogenase [Kiritimatiellia bacterium]